MNPSLHLDEFVLLNERSCIISINVDVSRSVDHELFEVGFTTLYLKSFELQKTCVIKIG